MQTWDDFLNFLEKDFGEDTVSKWLKTLKVLKFDAMNLYLQADDQFQLLWFEEHVRTKANRSFLNTNQKPIKIHLQVKKTAQDIHPYRQVEKPSFFYAPDVLKKDALFDHFIVTDENKMAFDLLSNLSLPMPSSSTIELGSFNPILIYGTKESGKTHLLMATGHFLHKLGLRACYVKAETFTDHVIRAIRNGNMIEFRKNYRNVDVLIVDDLEVFSGKSATQEEFFHTYNTLHTEGKQLILASSIAPKYFTDIEPRLVSRFEWGLTISIKPLDAKGLTLLIDHQLKKQSFSLNADSKKWLSEHFSKPSSLLKALDIIKFRSQLFRQQGLILPLDVIQSYLKDFLEELNQLIISPHRILEELANHYKVKIDDLLGKSQAREHTVPRQLAMYVCRFFLKMPYTKIGAFFSRDHSTVITSVKHVESALAGQDSPVTHVIEDLCRKIGLS